MICNGRVGRVGEPYDTNTIPGIFGLFGGCSLAHKAGGDGSLYAVCSSQEKGKRQRPAAISPTGLRHSPRSALPAALPWKGRLLLGWCLLLLIQGFVRASPTCYIVARSSPSAIRISRVMQAIRTLNPQSALHINGPTVTTFRCPGALACPPPPAERKRRTAAHNRERAHASIP